MNGGRPAAERVTAIGQFQIPGVLVVGAREVTSAMESPGVVTAARMTSSPPGHRTSRPRSDRRGAWRSPRARVAPSTLTQLVHGSRDALAALLAEFCEPALGQAVGRQLRPEVTLPLVRIAHVGENGDDLVREANRGNDQALLVEVGRAGGQLAGSAPPTSA